ncbi:MAG: hypothetical protein AB1458_06955 [Bacteroidota bacterium]
MLNRTVIFAFVMLLQLAAAAQVDSLNRAIDCYDKNQLKCAQTAIDAASVHPQTSIMPKVHLLRGFIYKEIYKTMEVNNVKSPARDQAIASLIKFIGMDSAKYDENYPAVIKTIRYLASSYYNNAGQMLNPTDYKTAIQYYELYDKYMAMIDNQWNPKIMFVDFYMGLGSGLNDYYESNRSKYPELMEIIGSAYKKVIATDSSNVTAYYNLGMLYYNMGVVVINESSDELDIADLDKVQGQALEYFKLALPYMLKAYALNPKRKEVLIALSGIYFSMHEEEKSAAIKAELDKLDK